MNPNAPQPSFELPTPQPVPTGEAGTRSFEQTAPGPETNTKPGGVTSQPLQPQIADPASVPAVPQPASPPPASNVPVADDADLIEKEWVIKAKQIVAATKDDPHTQSKEISRFKADYLKKRYNKDVKIEES